MACGRTSATNQITLYSVIHCKDLIGQKMSFTKKLEETIRPFRIIKRGKKFLYISEKNALLTIIYA